MTNPNDWEAVTATVTDSVTIDGVTCTIDEGAAVYDTSNVVKVTWDQAAAHTPTGETTGTKPVTLGQSSVNDTVTITDTPAGGATVTLGTASLSGITPAAGITKVDDWTFGYTTSYAGVPGTCTPYDNTCLLSTSRCV